jgi:ferredoxin
VLPVKLSVDQDLCAAFGICVGIVPDVIKLDGSGFAYTENEGNVPAELEEAARNAVLDCPSGAISADE